MPGTDATVKDCVVVMVEAAGAGSAGTIELLK